MKRSQPQPKAQLPTSSEKDLPGSSNKCVRITGPPVAAATAIEVFRGPRAAQQLLGGAVYTRLLQPIPLTLYY